jgi:hypothetical protein
MKQLPPASLKIVGRDISVELLDVMDDRVGEMDHNTNTIRITKGQQQLTEADTLLHECLHSIDECFQLKLSERQVYCLAVGVLALLKDNPEMLEYINYSIKNPREV